jgi:hypothetical protein
MKKLGYVVLTVVLLMSLAVPVFADDGQGQVVFPGSTFVVESGEVIRHDVVVLGGSLDVRAGGRIDGDVTVFGGNSSVDGRIDGNLAMVGGNLTLGSEAVVDGDLVTFGGNVTQDQGAVVRGERIQGSWINIGRPTTPVSPVVPRLYFPSGWSNFENWFGGLVSAVMSAVALIALGLLLFYLLPRQMAVIEQTVRRAPAASLGVGLLTLIMLPIALVLLVITCIGIPVAVLVALLAAAAGICGWIVVGAMLGRWMLATLKARVAPALDVVAGVGTLSLLSAVPCVGWLLSLVVATAGLGAVVLTRFGTRSYESGGRSNVSQEPPVSIPVEGSQETSSTGSTGQQEPATAEAGGAPSAPPQGSTGEQ